LSLQMKQHWRYQPLCSVFVPSMRFENKTSTKRTKQFRDVCAVFGGNYLLHVWSAEQRHARLVISSTLRGYSFLLSIKMSKRALKYRMYLLVLHLSWISLVHMQRITLHTLIRG
jgi:hypothetical protein